MPPVFYTVIGVNIFAVLIVLLTKYLERRRKEESKELGNYMAKAIINNLLNDPKEKARRKKIVIDVLNSKEKK